MGAGTTRPRNRLSWRYCRRPWRKVDDVSWTSDVERAFEVCGDKADIVLVFKVGNACPQCVLNDKDVKYA